MSRIIEVSLTLRGFERSPVEACRMLGSGSAELRQKGQRINGISEATFKDSSVREEITLLTSESLSEGVARLARLWGGWTRIGSVIRRCAVVHVELDIFVRDGVGSIEQPSFFLDVETIAALASVSGTVSFAYQPKLP